MVPYLGSGYGTEQGKGGRDQLPYVAASGKWQGKGNGTCKATGQRGAEHHSRAEQAFPQAG